jgi:NADH-quinone oxidoreductase subunit J
MILTIVVLALTLLAALWAVMTAGLIRSVLGLAATSVCLTVLMFMLGANLAAVFELSVCAGLITVVFVSTISMTQPADRSGLLDRTRAHLRRYWLLPIILVAAGAMLAFLTVGVRIDLPPPTESADVRDTLWKSRQTDLLGQVVVILAGVFGVIVLFKERKEK